MNTNPPQRRANHHALTSAPNTPAAQSQHPISTVPGEPKEEDRLHLPKSASSLKTVVSGTSKRSEEKKKATDRQLLERKILGEFEEAVPPKDNDPLDKTSNPVTANVLASKIKGHC